MHSDGKKPWMVPHHGISKVLTQERIVFCNKIDKDTNIPNFDAVKSIL